MTDQKQDPFTQPVGSYEFGAQDELPFGPEPELAEPTEPTELYADVKLLDRMRTLKDSAGFMPTSVGEANEAFTLLAYIGSAGATAGHLAEISAHQVRAKTGLGGHEAAVRSVTNEYAGYLRKAIADGSNLVNLRSTLGESVADSQLTSLKTLGLIYGMPQLIRYYDLKKLLDDGVVTIDPFMKRKDGRRSALDPYTIGEPSKAMVAHFDRVAGQTRLWQARRDVGAMIADQSARADFWKNRLREARLHMTAKPIAEAALKQFGAQLERV